MESMEIYTVVMTKRLIDIDDELLERARRATGAETMKATVEIALRRLVDREVALKHVERLREPGALDLTLIEQAREPKFADND